MFQSKPPDICVLDIMMPVKDGYTLAEDIRKQNSGIPIIFRSAKSWLRMTSRMKSGGNDYPRKPFNIGELFGGD
jgi:DNA-binding response OmpR family regulator